MEAKGKKCPYSTKAEKSDSRKMYRIPSALLALFASVFGKNPNLFLDN